MIPGPFTAAIASAKAGDPPPGVAPELKFWYDIPSLQAGVAVYAGMATEPKGPRLLPPSEAVPLLY